MKNNTARFEDLQKKCCGCGACCAECPEAAISMIPDEEGFLFPAVDETRCISCGKCLEVCQLSAAKEEKREPLAVYACQALDQQVLIEATAGGLFPTLAEFVIGCGGVVYGAAYNAKMEVVHVGVQTKEGLSKFSGSKYVQSNVTEVFGEIRAHLENGRTVLFSGTPCQIYALRRFCANVNTDNLITIDVVCYGVPSAKLFRAYIEKLEKKFRGRVEDFRFRDKHTYGWSHTTVIKIHKKTGETVTVEQPDHRKIAYYKMFSYRDCFRKSCYSCPYNTIQRCSDFTTGNFWGIENISTAFDTTKGVSMLLINTQKGQQIFQRIKNKMQIEQRTLQEAIQANDALIKTVAYPEHRDGIYKTFAKNGLTKTMQKYYSAISVRNLIAIAYRVKCKLFGKRR